MSSTKQRFKAGLRPLLIAAVVVAALWALDSASSAAAPASHESAL